jgi:hypothetical protein
VKLLTAAEESFHNVLWKLLETFYGESGSKRKRLQSSTVCTTVRLLDDMVQDGRVDRGRAAVCCNVMACTDRGQDGGVFAMGRWGFCGMCFMCFMMSVCKAVWDGCWRGALVPMCTA